MEGFGLRRNEGFGRIAFNHPVYDNACQSVGDVTEIKASDLLLRGNAHHDDTLVPEARSAIVGRTA